MCKDKVTVIHKNLILEDPAYSKEITLKPVISVIHGIDKGRIFPFTSSVTIGRGSNADFIINDEQISRIHIKVTLKANAFIIEDMGSTNGTYIEGNKINNLTAVAGSVVHIGESKLVFSLKSEAQIDTEKELYKAAATDALTEISSRLWFMKRADEEIVYARNTDLPLTMIMLDIDFFKKVNDNYGHLAGDYILKQLAAILLKHKRKNDLLGRYGGEEFILLLKDLTAEEAVLISERIRQAVESAEFIYRDHKIPITISMGVCSMQGDNLVDLTNCILIADKLLYKAKENGRNKVEIG
ncbi:MAG: GGDEF domain-containing protein [gamma proteobacterium symbiont of Taylorina sp.]|nr:GGDEF domain-containing protein [gamma proteobacterium symbiont of Taylorina sp.]